MRVLTEKFAEEFKIASGSDVVPLQLLNSLRYKEKVEEVDLLGALNLYTEGNPWDWCGYTYSTIIGDYVDTNRFQDIGDLKNHLHAKRYDIIHSHTRGKKLNELNKGLHRWGTPLIYTMHGMDGLDNPLDKEMFDEADLITTPSMYAAQKITERFPDYAEKVLAVPNSTNFTGYTYDEDVVEKSKELKEKYAPNGEDLILITGRLQEDKGVYELGEAIINLLDERKNIKLMHSGIVFDDGDRKKLKTMFEERGYGDKLILNGKIPEGDEKMLAAIYQAADVFVLPSDGTYENMSVSALEALAMETPLVASAQGGTNQVYIEPGFGIGVESRNIKSIQKGIDYTLSNYEQEKERAKRARQIIWKFYNTDFIADTWIKIYEKLEKDLPVIPNMPDENHAQSYYEKITNWFNH